jgi:hypothetical protein
MQCPNTLDIFRYLDTFNSQKISNIKALATFERGTIFRKVKKAQNLITCTRIVAADSVILLWKRESANEIITHAWHFQRGPTDDIGYSIQKLVDINDMVKTTKCRGSVDIHVSDHIGV